MVVASKLALQLMSYLCIFTETKTRYEWHTAAVVADQILGAHYILGIIDGILRRALHHGARRQYTLQVATFRLFELLKEMGEIPRCC